MNNLVLKKGADHEAFVAWLEENGIAFKQMKRLKRHFRVEGFPEHEDILSVEEDKLIGGAAQQALTLNPNMTGSWQLMRTIRRKAPYPTRPLKKSHDSFFEAVLDGTGVDIHIIDTGVSDDITELASPSRLVYTYFATADTGTHGDDNGHGTACAVLAAGSVHGIARGAEVLSYKALSASNSGAISDIVDCMDQTVVLYGARSNPAVVSMSLGAEGNSIIVNAAMDDMIDEGMVVVIAAGNDSEDLGSFVSTFAESDDAPIVVGGSSYDDWSYMDGDAGTNWGTRVDILSPSRLTETIRATDDGGGPDTTRLFSGTSAGCPIVAGVMACYLQGLPKLTSRAQALAAKAYLLDKATTGAAKFHSVHEILPDRIVYLDPKQTVNVIPGINA